jgi:hypothetical protein
MFIFMFALVFVFVFAFISFSESLAMGFLRSSRSVFEGRQRRLSLGWSRGSKSSLWIRKLLGVGLAACAGKELVLLRVCPFSADRLKGENKIEFKSR